MVQKAKPVQEDPQTKARREQAEQNAEKRQIDGIKGDVSRETAAILRRFGVRAALAGAPGAAGGFGGGGGGSVNVTGGGGGRSAGVGSGGIGGIGGFTGGNLVLR